MDGKSLSPQKELGELLKTQFPQVFAEGKVNPDKLKQALGEELDTNNERYGLSWAGKAECFHHIQETTTATLKPIKSESVDFDKTENIFIEGDNLEVLKILQKAYQNKIKMIYIDPPYNTGNDSFIYPDRFKEEKADYEERAGIKDAEGLLTKDGFFRKNSKDAGHFHSNWLSMMYPRLFLAKNLLREDGVIFVSIDDNEVHNLRMIMDEVFGEENFVAQITWKKKTGAGSKINLVFDEHEYVLTYVKSSDAVMKWRIKSEEDGTFRNPDNDTRGSWESCAITAPSSNRNPNQLFAIEIFFNKKVEPSKEDKKGRKLIKTVSYGKHTVVLRELIANDKESYEEYDEKNQHALFIRRWVNTKDSILKLFEQERVYFNGPNLPRYKKFESEYEGKAMRSIYFDDFSTQEGSEDFIKLMGFPFVGYPKPISLNRHLIQIIDNEDIVLDFFAGSCTTAHAVMQLNAEDGGDRKFICVQLAEPCEKESEAFKAGFKTIADIGKERIRRAGKKIKKESSGKLDFDKNKLDLGFKVFRLEESNFKQWRENIKEPEEFKKQLWEMVDNVKKGAAGEDMLFEIILKNSRFDLNVATEKRNYDGIDYYILATEHTEDTEGKKAKDKKVNHGLARINTDFEIVCLDLKITKKFVDKVLAEKPERFTCLDAAFKNNDQLKTNTALQMENAKIEFKVI